MNKVILLGASGQLGQETARQLLKKNYELTRIDHDQFEAATDFDKLDQFQDADIIINCIAFHDVNRCETEFTRSMKINGEFVKQLALFCDKHNITLIHISTDYVFDGKKKTPYTETDLPAPLNAYGVSKLAGEMLVKAYCRKHYILRVAGLFGVKENDVDTNNFVEKMIRAAHEKQSIKVIEDQIMSPTYTKDIARAMIALIEQKAEFGLYHGVNSGSVSWYDFALKIFQLTGHKADISPITYNEYHSIARRPQYCSLDNSKIMTYYEMPSWTDAMAGYLREKGQIK